ncbi:hypothetical protein HAX54_031287, partial [Datura stramonium]|nr:hypothetical protein [Datura stramonium]
KLINKEKSSFYLYKKTLGNVEQEVADITSFGEEYALIFTLCYGSYRVHLNEIHRIFVKFFSKNKVEGRSKHWASWLKMCVPKEEGDLGFRNPHQETIEHLLLKGEVAYSIWNRYKSTVGMQGPFVQVKQTIVKWWKADYGPLLNCTIHSIPAMILWHIWKWRNTLIHGGNMSQFRIIQVMEGYYCQRRCEGIVWKPPPQGVYKCNIDGVAKDSGMGSWALCVQDWRGDFINATTNTIFSMLKHEQ